MDKVELPATTSWLARSHRRPYTAQEIIVGICEALVADGIPIFRVTSAVPSLHPLLRGRQVIWFKDGEARTINRPLGVEATRMYQESPAKAIHDGAPFIRQRLDLPDDELSFPVLKEVKDAGGTDYFAMPLQFSNGRICFVAWATNAAAGFRAADIAALQSLEASMALRCELEATQFAMRALLSAYLGKVAAEQVLGGTVQRGQGEIINAAICFTDLRNYTGYADCHSSADTIARINIYFERLTDAVQAHGGDVLKFIGDGMLAIFPINADNPRARACQNALQAVVSAQGRISEYNAGLSDDSEIRFGAALHVGEVMFGNIGAPDRLDFTVIGPAVNHVSRIESLCSATGHVVLASREFAANVDCDALQSIGLHKLKSLAQPIEVFALTSADP